MEQLTHNMMYLQNNSNVLPNKSSQVAKMYQKIYGLLSQANFQIEDKASQLSMKSMS